MSVFAAIQVVVRFAPVLAQFILGQMIVALARIRNTFAIDAVTVIPPSVCRAVFSFCTTVGFAIGFASISNNMVVIRTCCQLARTAATYHRLAIFWHLAIAVVPTFATVRRTRLDIDTFAIAIEFIALALGTTLTVGANESASTLGTRHAAACVRILHAFSRIGIYMKTVDALQDFALAIRTCATFPTGNGIDARTVMQTAVFDGIDLTGIVVDMHAFGTFAHFACCIHAITGSPTIDAQTACYAMGSAVVQIIGLTAIFVQMQPLLACTDLTCAICTSTF